MSQNRSGRHASKALSIQFVSTTDNENSFSDGGERHAEAEEEEKKSVQHFLTLNRITNEKRVPKERCHSQAAKVTLNNDRESDLSMRVARIKANRSLSRMDSTKDKVSMTIEAYREWQRSFDLTCRRVGLREVKNSADPSLLKLPPLRKPAAIIKKSYNR